LFKARGSIPLWCALWLIAATGLPAAETPPPSDAPKDILKKSLIFPGWGQLSEKQYVKGALFAASEIFCIVQFVLKNNKANDAYRRYRQAGNVADAIAFRQLTEKYDKQRNWVTAGGAFVWILNLVDIYLTYHHKNHPAVLPALAIHDPHTFSLGCRIYF